MGASTQKSIRNIIDSKYSFVHPKSHFPLQLSCWKFTQEDLQRRIDCEGEAVRWPFKLYSDQGYIFCCIQNNNLQDSHKNLLQGKEKAESPWRQLGSLRVSVGVVQLLYFLASREVEEYCTMRIQLQNTSKYIKDRLTLTIYVYTGQNLSSLAKLKLLTHAIALERYLSRGGICSISKLYHQYQDISDLGKEVRLKDQGKAKTQEFYIQIGSLVEEKVRVIEDEKARKEVEQRQLLILFNKMNNFSLVKKLLLDPYIKQPTFNNLISSDKKNTAYTTIDCSEWSSHKNLILKEEAAVQKKAVEAIKQQQRPGNKKQVQKLQDLNQSMPFACQITEINFKEKKKMGDVGQLNESMSIAQLSVLGQRQLNFIKIVTEQQDYLILTDYASIREYTRCVQLNVRLVINNNASLCNNYFINDFQYIWNYITPLPAKQPAQVILFEYNIQHLFEKITQAVIHHTCNNKRADSLNNRVAIYSASSPFSDENCAIVIGYLICRYLYTFQKAFDVLSRHFKEYSKSKQARLELHRLYVDQLLTLEGRVLITSRPNYGVNLNLALWRVYQVSNNHCHPSQRLISRYIGQISNLNQISSLANHPHHAYIVVSHQIISVLTQIVEKWEKDATIRVPQGISGVKIMVGKEFQFREEFVSKAKEMLPLIVKYEFVSRGRNSYSFLNPFLLRFIGQLVQTNVQVESIQKSFRKPQPFTPLYLGFEQQTPAREGLSVGQPFNSKQKLIFKYPYLRPTWQAIRDDQHYFIIQVRKESALIQLVKGKHWIGLQTDKQAFLDNLVKLYIQNIDESKIEVVQQGEQSLFASPDDM